MVTLEEFKKCELIIAKILEVSDHPNAERLYVLKIDTGKEIKQLVAGIRKAYTKEELQGRKIVVVNNLEPAVIRGETSQGMLLAASDEQGLALLSIDKDIALGSPVKWVVILLTFLLPKIKWKTAFFQDKKGRYTGFLNVFGKEKASKGASRQAPGS